MGKGETRKAKLSVYALRGYFS